MPESFDIKINNLIKNKKPALSFDKAIVLIKEKKLAPALEKHLIKQLQNSPVDTYANFIQNLHVHIAKTKNNGKSKEN